MRLMRGNPHKHWVEKSMGNTRETEEGVSGRERGERATEIGKE